MSIEEIRARCRASVTDMVSGTAEYYQSQQIIRDRQELLTAYDAASAHIAQLEAVVRDAECLLTIVEPRSHKAEYLALLHKARVALDMEPSTPQQPTGDYTDSIDVLESFAAETAVKPVCLRDTESHGKGICEICEDGPCTDNGIYAETWDERMGRKP